jgi:hypothetical protein
MLEYRNVGNFEVFYKGVGERIASYGGLNAIIAACAPAGPPPPNSPYFDTCSMWEDPFHVAWSVESECTPTAADVANNFVTGNPYISNIHDYGDPADRQDCVNNPDPTVTGVSCTDTIMYFRNVVPAYPYVNVAEGTTNERVDLKVTVVAGATEDSEIPVGYDRSYFDYDVTGQEWIITYYGDRHETNPHDTSGNGKWDCKLLLFICLSAFQL